MVSTAMAVEVGVGIGKGVLAMAQKKKKGEWEAWIDKNPLRKWRSAEEMTMAEAAVRIGKSLVTLRNWETGATIPTDDSMETLKKVTSNKKLEEEWTSWSTSRPH
jgi:DNA-binding transcriptional regulator YiaG